MRESLPQAFHSGSGVVEALASSLIDTGPLVTLSTESDHKPFLDTPVTKYYSYLSGITVAFTETAFAVLQHLAHSSNKLYSKSNPDLRALLKTRHSLESTVVSFPCNLLEIGEQIV